MTNPLPEYVPRERVEQADRAVRDATARVTDLKRVNDKLHADIAELRRDALATPDVIEVMKNRDFLLERLAEVRATTKAAIETLQKELGACTVERDFARKDADREAGNAAYWRERAAYYRDQNAIGGDQFKIVKS